ncbi:MAG: DUF4399 domain-containing protein [Pseudohongiellaceae bacterium]|nr:DUF4399 domain-containing protein [Pseudohongiellaceae bacterium]
MNKITFALLATLSLVSFKASAQEMISEAPADAQAYFISPQDGETVGQTVKIVFGLKNMGVAPSGVDRANTGHHHLLINTDELPDLSQALPASENVMHFGGGQTETEITLEPGVHTLQMVLGNFAHVPHKNPVMSEKITITVE